MSIYTGLIVAGTGHRPDKLGGYSDDAFNLLVKIAKHWLEMNKPTRVISGMALGWDQALATAAVEVDIPFVAAVPFNSQENTWPDSAKIKYSELLKKATEIFVLSDTYSINAMHYRNAWMVDHSHVMLALWDGSIGGTSNCIRYAQSKDKHIINLYNIYKSIKERQ
jgi:uncharacterized phage-like protein YoqJ